MFGWLFGNAKVVDKAVDAVIRTGDSLFFTEEERSNASHKILEWKIRYAEATQNQSISRRIITIGVTAMWLLVGAVTLLAKGLGYDAYADFAFKFLVDVVMQPFSIILAFYFLAHIAKGKDK